MTREDFTALKPGDLIRHRLSGKEAKVLRHVWVDSCVAVLLVVGQTEADAWEVVRRAEQQEGESE